MPLTIHTLDPDDAYGQAMTDDAIMDGDVLVIPSLGIAGFLMGGWPVAIIGDASLVGFHTLADDADVTRLGAHPIAHEGTMWEVPADPGRDYSASVDAARGALLSPGYTSDILPLLPTIDGIADEMLRQGWSARAVLDRLSAVVPDACPSMLAERIAAAVLVRMFGAGS